MEERVEELGVKKRSYPISRELKLVALYRKTSVAVCVEIYADENITVFFFSSTLRLE